MTKGVILPSGKTTKKVDDIGYKYFGIFEVNEATEKETKKNVS